MTNEELQKENIKEITRIISIAFYLSVIYFVGDFFMILSKTGEYYFLKLLFAGLCLLGGILFATPLMKTK